MLIVYCSRRSKAPMLSTRFRYKKEVVLRWTRRVFGVMDVL